MSTISAYPLSWPEGLPRHEKTVTAAFKTTLPAALKNVRDALTRFSKDSDKAISDIIISSNVTLGAEKPKNAGVAVWFKWDAQQLCIAVDRYPTVQDNLQAIYHIIEARRTELRHGGLNLIRQTFKGFQAKALPPGKRHWKEVLGLDGLKWVPLKSDVEDAYRKLSARYHPDKNGGDDRLMRDLNIAREEALKDL